MMLTAAGEVTVDGNRQLVLQIKLIQLVIKISRSLNQHKGWLQLVYAPDNPLGAGRAVMSYPEDTGFHGNR